MTQLYQGWFVFLLLWIPLAADPVTESWQEEYTQLRQQISQPRLAKTAASRLAVEVANKNCLIWESDRTPTDVALRRGEALLSHLKTLPDAPDLSGYETDIARIRARSLALAKTVGTDSTLYLELRAVLRKVAFSNPLLDFSDMIFVTKGVIGKSGSFKNADGPDYKGMHQTGNYFGQAQRYGGGLFLLKDFKGDSPSIVNLAGGKTITSGAGKGQTLGEGAYQSPELSFDGKTILFAYAKKAYPKLKGRTWEYTEGNSFHIFRINVDGTGLTQLTSGNWNDFDPCYLPNGRIAFISTRTHGRGRGWIYPRCYKVPAPAQFMLASMKPDGSDIIPLSFHETDEYQPSVTNDGMIVYSRWDYVDRDANVAQHMWLCYPDGRDPRSWHANYPLPHSTMEKGLPDQKTMRPFAEWHIRAVPKSSTYSGSSKFFAVAGPHHGEPYGPLALIDTDIKDDNLMAQTRRFTPEPWPESEIDPKTGYVYGSPWPLSEDYVLANYQTGLCLIDKFGNRETISIPKINGSSVVPAGMRPLDPFPVKQREVPPVITTGTWDGERKGTAGHRKATISVMNCYVSDVPLPAGVKVKELRIIQYFPKSNHYMHDPQVSYGNQSLVRMALGTVPVEEDGSVYFEAPVGKGISFQLIDTSGMAVQWMRSITYAHHGEQLTCAGCHEDKWEAVPPMSPLAMKRPPSKITLEVGGLEPINYYRLVKPVLDEHCTPCHTLKKKGPNMSYGSLKDYATYKSCGNPFSTTIHFHRIGGSRSNPGFDGAYAAPLYTGGYITGAHNGVQLTKEERRKITLWLDCNSNAFGSYDDTVAQRKGRLVWPAFDCDTTNLLGVENDISTPSVPGQTLSSRPAHASPLSVRQAGRELLIRMPGAGSFTVTLTSLTGRRLVSLGLSGSRLALPITNLSAGIYLLTVTSGSSRQQRRVAVVR